MQMRIVRAKEFQELLHSTCILVGIDSEVSNGKEKKLWWNYIKISPLYQGQIMKPQ
jgi:hypothetical protein